MNEPKPGYGISLRAGIGALLGGALLMLLVLSVHGCGQEPGPEDLLTTVELSPGPAVGDSLPQTARAHVTFRDWFNGGVVIEARVSSSLTAGDLAPLLEGDAEAHAQAWDQVMAASTSGGFSEQLVVGYRGLIREIDLELPAGLATGDTTRTFLVAYLADIEEIERNNQPDSLVITPYNRDAGILNDVAIVGAEAP